MRENYLVHHGINGQRWGHRNGPPYPLGSSDHSAAERKAGTSGWSKEAKKESSSNSTEKKEFDYKKALKIGAIAAGTALAAYGTYKIATNPKVRQLALSSKYIVNNALEVGKNEYRYGKNPNSLKEELLQHYKEFEPGTSDIDKFFSGNKYNNTGRVGFDDNCVACALGQCFAKQNISTTAAPNIVVDNKSGMVKAVGVGKYFEQIKSSLPGTIIKNETVNDTSELRSILNTYPEGSYGILGYRHSKGGHAIHWSKTNGKITLSDNQKANELVKIFMNNLGFDEETARNRVYDYYSNLPDKYFNKHVDFSKEIRHMRIDNATKMDYSIIDEFLF